MYYVRSGVCVQYSNQMNVKAKLQYLSALTVLNQCVQQGIIQYTFQQ
jgi:hypothetical protein